MYYLKYYSKMVLNFLFPHLNSALEDLLHKKRIILQAIQRILPKKEGAFFYE